MARESDSQGALGARNVMRAEGQVACARELNVFSRAQCQSEHLKSTTCDDAAQSSQPEIAASDKNAAIGAPLAVMHCKLALFIMSRIPETQLLNCCTWSVTWHLLPTLWDNGSRPAASELCIACPMQPLPCPSPEGSEPDCHGQ